MGRYHMREARAISPVNAKHVYSAGVRGTLGIVDLAFR